MVQGSPAQLGALPPCGSLRSPGECRWRFPAEAPEDFTEYRDPACCRPDVEPANALSLLLLLVLVPVDDGCSGGSSLPVVDWIPRSSNSTDTRRLPCRQYLSAEDCIYFWKFIMFSGGSTWTHFEREPPRSNFLCFHAVFGKLWPNNRVGAPLRNPWFAPEVCFQK